MDEILNLFTRNGIELTLLARGEYNVNYTFLSPRSGRKLVLRINAGSQMHLEDQIGYEFRGLLLVYPSGRTPRPIYLDKDFMVMEYLPGRALDYRGDLPIAADILADIHSLPADENCGLVAPSDSLGAILDECEQMVQTYYRSNLGDAGTKRQIERLLRLGRRKAEQAGPFYGRRCIINTELNSGNFLINGPNRPNYLIDWEKPLYGDPAQDLGHFLAPTTTYWKTDVILSPEEMAAFAKRYMASVNGRYDTRGIESRLDLFIPITCLRGITWSAMAWVEYQQPDKLIRNEDTFRKMEEYLSPSFLDMIEKRYYRVPCMEH